jgi:hypothetical protein
MLITLVGNKCEIKEREVELSEGEQFAKGFKEDFKFIYL